MMRSFSKEYLVGAGETDCFNYCRPSAFLNFMQDTATLHAGMIGLSRDTLVKNFGAIWILARCWFRLSEPIHAFETVQVETWHRGLRGVMWYRDFKISINGRHVGDATNAWVLADVETHRARRPVGMEEIDEKFANPDRSLGITLGKLSCKDTLFPCLERTIRYSDLDVNCHLNNVKYADLICDAISLDQRKPCYFRELQINYNGECKAGDTIILASNHESSFVSGCGKDGSDRFTAQFTL